MGGTCLSLFAYHGGKTYYLTAEGYWILVILNTWERQRWKEAREISRLELAMNNIPECSIE
jgi:hypothetical protein